MVSDTIIAIKDCILQTVGNDCEKIILFGSYAYGTPNKESDYDIFVILKRQKLFVTIVSSVQKKH